MRLLTRIFLVCWSLVFLPLCVAAGPGVQTNAFDAALVRAVTLADGGDLAKAVELLNPFLEKQKLPRAGIMAAGKFYSDSRLFVEGAAALRRQAAICDTNDLAFTRREEARLLYWGGDVEAALQLMESLASGAVPGLSERERAAVQAQIDGGMKGALRLAEAVIIQEPVGIHDTLEAIRRKAEAGEPGQAVARLVSLIKAQREQVVIRKDGMGVEAADFIRQAVSAWPPAVQAAFADELEKEVGKAFEISPDGDLRKLGELWLLYHGTKAGDAGMMQAADRLMDEGASGVALWFYGLLRRGVQNPLLDAKYALACSQAGDTNALAGFLKSLPPARKDAAVMLGRQATTLGAFTAGLAARTPTTDTAPKVSPAAARSWAAPVSPVERLYVNASRSGPYYRDKVTDVIPTPAVAGEALYVNSGRALRRFEAATGSHVWITPFVPEIVDERGGGRLGGGGHWPAPKMPPPVFGAKVWNDQVICRHAGLVTTAGYLVWNGLTAVDAASGVVRWRTRDNPEFKGLHVASEPCVAGGLVYLLTRNNEVGDATVRAVALDARTGRVVWSRTLTMGPDGSRALTYNPEALAFELPAPLAAERGVLFATHMGRMFFLDPLSGAVVWMRRYPQAPDDGTIAGTPVSPALLAGGTIVVAPRDSCRIYALEADTGRLVWEQPAGRDPFLCGVWRDRVVAAGRGVRLLDRATGSPAGQMKMSSPVASVLGSVAGDRLWLSGANALCRFDLAAMKEMDVVPVSDRLLPVGRHAVGCEPDRVAAYLAGPEPLNPAVKLPSVARPVVTPAGEAALAPGKVRPAVEPSGLIAPRLLWRTVMPLSNVSMPDENRGIVLLWGRYAARMIHAEGFGETLWEFNSRSPFSQFVWAGETLVAVTGEALVGLDPARGTERWKVPGVGPNTRLFLIQGDLICMSMPNNAELIRINPADGSVRWRCVAPAGQTFGGSYSPSILRETGGQMYGFMGPASDPRSNWSIVRLGADGKLGKTLFGQPADGSSFWDLTAERAYLVKQGQGTSCWDPALKQKFWALKTNPHYDEPFERAPDRRILPAPDGGPPLWISRPPVNERDNPPRVVLDPLTGERCYEGDGSRWNSSILKTVGTELSRIIIGRGKKPQVAWSVKLPSGRDEACRWHLPETGAALGVIRATGAPWNPPHTLRYDVLDPASGKVLAQRTLGWSRDIVERAEWKYANSRIFVTAGRELLCYQAAAPGGEAAWFAGRRQAALRVADSAERVQALRCANMSEQMFREAELTWRPAGGPLKLDQAWQWLPGAADNALRFSDWGGPQDVSCVATATANADFSLNLTIDVRDDAWVPLAGGRGDAVMIERDGQRLAVGLDARHFPVVLGEDGAASDAIGVPSVSRIGRDIVRYTLLIPAAWQLDPHRREDKALRFILGVAIRDDDGAGVKGVLNWGGPASRSVVRFE